MGHRNGTLEGIANNAWGLGIRKKGKPVGEKKADTTRKASENANGLNMDKIKNRKRNGGRHIGIDDKAAIHC